MMNQERNVYMNNIAKKNCGYNTCFDNFLGDGTYYNICRK